MNREVLPGIGVAAVIAVVGTLLSSVVPNLGAMTLSLLLGIAVGQWLCPQQQLNAGVTFAEKKVLTLAVALLGVKLNLFAMEGVGVSDAVIVVLSTTLVIFAGLLLGPVFGLTRQTGLLVGVGSGICGSSAIAAAAPLVPGTDKKDIGLSLGTINLLGVVGLLGLPMAVGALSAEWTTSAVTIGGSLPAVGHVVASGYMVSEQVGEMATAVKMGRVSLLLPVLAVLAWRGAGKAKMPLALLGFVALAALVTLGVLPEPVVDVTGTASKWLLTLAMAAIGLHIRLGDLLKAGPRALLLGAVVFALQVTFLFVAASLF